MMDFNDHKPIYLQIADLVGERVLSGDWTEGNRIPSVRELGAELGVNPNTVVRSYEQLTRMDIIQNKRGIGFFICEGATERLKTERRNQFLQEEAIDIFRKMVLLDISEQELMEEFRKWTAKL